MATTTPQNILPHSGEAFLYRGFFNAPTCQNYFDTLYSEIKWQTRPIRLFGKSILQPRLVAWYGDDDCTYTYSHTKWDPLPWTETLLSIKASLQVIHEASLNSVLLNLYRNGKDHMGWHQDNEPELGKHPVIISVSLGATRPFDFRLRQNPKIKNRIQLQNGDVLVMSGETQTHWQHCLPKSLKVLTPRMNLTFRCIHPPIKTAAKSRITTKT